MMNPEFEGVNPRELMDTSVNSWVHHCMNILPQVRLTAFIAFGNFLSFLVALG